MSILRFWVGAVGGLFALAMSLVFVWVAEPMTDRDARSLLLLAAAVVAEAGLLAIAEVL